MHYLVTGGAGFIGSHIVEALLARGDGVRILDDFSSGKQANVPAGVEVINSSITDPVAIAPAFMGIQGVFHTAALPRVQLSIDKPRETNEVNITGTLNILLAARDAGVKRVVYSASSSAYGDQPTLPLHEEMKLNPKSPYGLQKYVGEEYCKMASLFWGVETVSLRYFNVYGPRLTFEGAYVTVIAVFLKQRAEGVPLTITGDGTQTRDFTYIDDVVAANLLAMDSAKVGQGEVMNIGAGSNHSVNEVAALVGGLTTHIEPRVEPHDTLADVRRARELLGWVPQVKFEEGLKRTMEWFEKM
ncbi:MAG: UDP-glucose 4-epimerase [Parcubacteria group bacterium GW2011_GWC2_45_7]|nr:MAG: UDP-glucose 4-epimerase [Parcubacteria group bacterium GW2011_GWC2_45_7]KKU73002.1 MAG: UDP-glucose 4-epimerase [Parcubacteria group bacterium GW2011_GWA2_47_26]